MGIGLLCRFDSAVLKNGQREAEQEQRAQDFLHVLHKNRLLNMIVSGSDEISLSCEALIVKEIKSF